MRVKEASEEAEKPLAPEHESASATKMSQEAFRENSPQENFVWGWRGLYGYWEYDIFQLQQLIQFWKIYF